MSDQLTYYKDVYAQDDTEEYPGRRPGERCLNCDQFSGPHYGWACHSEDEGKSFDDIPWERRYVTVSMRKSRNLTIKGKYAYKYTTTPTNAAPVGVDLSDWRVWAHDYHNHDHCKCGRPRKGCEYHDPNMQRGRR